MKTGSTLAHNLINWFSADAGEFDVEGVASLFSLDPKLLRAWCEERGTLFARGELMGSGAWPAIWEEFSGLSEVARDLHAAFTTQLRNEVPRIVYWAMECERELEAGRMGAVGLSGGEKERPGHTRSCEERSATYEAWKAKGAVDRLLDDDGCPEWEEQLRKETMPALSMKRGAEGLKSATTVQATRTQKEHL
ncbi:MAG: hypothetical protein EOP09_14855 [Proteobacteria bacterium]|nr:MAG: hypothetical protein EOP09_14855 [Pseudomonadota bacterium]